MNLIFINYRLSLGFLGPSNMFRMSSQKKKTYAQVPGLTLGDDNSNKGVNVFPSNMTSSNSDLTYSIPYSHQANEKSLFAINSQSTSNDLAITNNDLHMKNQRNEDFRFVQNEFSQSQSSEFSFNSNSTIHHPHFLDPNMTSFQMNPSTEIYNKTVSIDQSTNIINEMPPVILDPNVMENISFENFTTENILEPNSPINYSDICDIENSKAKKIVGKTNFKAKNLKRCPYSTSPPSKLNNMCKEKFAKMNSNDIHDLSNFTLSNSLNQQAKHTQSKLFHTDTNSQQQVTKSESVTNVQFPLIDQKPYEDVQNLQFQNFGPQDVSHSTNQVDPQFVDPANTETYDEPKFFNITDFKNDQNSIPNLNFPTPQGNIIVSPPESTNSNNKYRMTITNKRPKYYSGPIMSNAISASDPTPNLVSAPAVNSENNTIHNENQKSNQPFGLNLSKIQNVVTSFFNPYQSSTDESMPKTDNKNDMYNSDQNNSTPTFFSTSQIFSNASPYSQMDNNSTMSHNTSTFYSPPQVSSNVSSYSQIDDNAMSSFSIQNHESTQNSAKCIYEPSQAFSYVSPSTILNPNQEEISKTHSHTFDFAENLVPNLEQDTENVQSKVGFENNFTPSNNSFGTNPFIDFAPHHFENSDPHQSSIQQSLPNSLFEPEIDAPVLQKEPLKSHNLSTDTEIEYTHDFNSMFIKHENILHSSDNDKSMHQNLENMTIKFDNININSQKINEIPLNDFVIEPIKDTEKTEFEKFSSKHENLFENSVSQKEDNKNLFDSFSGSELLTNNDNITSNLCSTIPFSSSSIFTPIEGSFSCYNNSDTNDKFFSDSILNPLAYSNVPNEPVPDDHTHDFNTSMTDDSLNSQNILENDKSVETENNSCESNQQDNSTVSNFTYVTNDSVINHELNDVSNILNDNKSEFCDRSWDVFPPNIVPLKANIEVHENLANSVQTNDPEDDTEKADDEIKEIFSKVISNENLMKNMNMTNVKNLDSGFEMNDVQLSHNSIDVNDLHTSFSSELFPHNNSNINLIDSFDRSNISNSPVPAVKNCEISKDSLISNTNNDKSNVIFNSCETFDLNLNSQVLGNVSSSNPLFPNEPKDSAFKNESIDSLFDKSDTPVNSSNFFDNGIQFSNNFVSISNDSKSPRNFVTDSTPSLEKITETVTSESNVSNKNTESIPLFNYFSLMEPSSNDLNL